MGHRLSKIYTRSGDTGTTGLGDGSRVSKGDVRIALIGEIDETNAALGLVLAEELPDEVRALLTGVQHDLFDLGGEACLPGARVVGTPHVQRLEAAIERYNATLAPARDFILPGGTRAAAHAHLARTVCRRAERTLAQLSAQAVGEGARQYLNRLSDLLFVLARVLNRAGGRSEVFWEKRGSA
ncbi:MAG: cob(I)yrinic acid a,c-diamide adenosyltransferase [Azoarcus sp.]|jgi:cob(I)alamin adenosyltransferase|nr:cob(I)yrinic acid a,c-diamide adenosyltransferase [Azoarcus sp.]